MTTAKVFTDDEATPDVCWGQLKFADLDVPHWLPYLDLAGGHIAL